LGHCQHFLGFPALAILPLLEVNSLARGTHPSMLQGIVSFAALDFRKRSKHNQSDDQCGCVFGLLLSLSRAQLLQLKKKGRAKQDQGNVLSGNLHLVSIEISTGKMNQNESK
jgi:hypothetical protein